MDPAQVGLTKATLPFASDVYSFTRVALARTAPHPLSSALRAFAYTRLTLPHAHPHAHPHALPTPSAGLTHLHHIDKLRAVDLPAQLELSGEALIRPAVVA